MRVGVWKFSKERQKCRSVDEVCAVMRQAKD